MYAAVGNPDPGADVAPEIQLGVQLDGWLRRPSGFCGTRIGEGLNRTALVPPVVSGFCEEPQADL